MSIRESLILLQFLELEGPVVDSIFGHYYSLTLPVGRLHSPTLLNSGVAVWQALANEMWVEVTCITF